METITLYYRCNGSDKVYQASIESQGSGYTVQFAYGRRGSTLTSGTKTPEPLALDKARKIYEGLVRSKMAKGYTKGPDGTPYTGSNNVSTGILPQLLNPIDEGTLSALLCDRTHCLQPKHDGRRLLVLKQCDEITGINRRGLACGIPESIVAAARALPSDFLIDGEAVGDTLHAFDIHQWDSRDLRPLAYSKRLGVLFDLLVSARQSALSRVVTQSHPELKTQLFDQLRKEQAEGVVFKKLTAGYCAGRPNVGGDQLKYKFVETASVIVTAINSKRSVAIAVCENGTLAPAGNVTVPANQLIPRVGDVVEVRYLYAMPGSGALFQPVYLGARDDITEAECTRDQLKFRREQEEVAA